MPTLWFANVICLVVVQRPANPFAKLKPIFFSIKNQVSKFSPHHPVLDSARNMWDHRDQSLFHGFRAFQLVQPTDCLNQTNSGMHFCQVIFEIRYHCLKCGAVSQILAGTEDIYPLAALWIAEITTPRFQGYGFFRMI